MCLPFFIAPLPSSLVLAFISFFLLLHYAFRGFRWSGCYRSYNDIRKGANVSGQYPINAPIAGTGENGRDSWEVESHHQSVWRTHVTAWHQNCQPLSISLLVITKQRSMLWTPMGSPRKPEFFISTLDKVSAFWFPRPWCSTCKRVTNNTNLQPEQLQ